MGYRDHGEDVEWLGVGAIHAVASTQQAQVQILDFRLTMQRYDIRAKGDELGGLWNTYQLCATSS
jgi:hypothetical protein